MAPVAPARPQLDGLLQLASASLQDLTTTVQSVHHAIAALPFGAVRPLPGARLVQSTHDLIADAVYEGIRSSTSALGSGARQALAALPARHLPRIDTPHAWRDQAIGALNGAFGDRLAAQGNALTLGMTWAHQGTALPLCPDAFAAAFPSASERVVVFVHGLCSTERIWQFYRDTHDGRDYAERLAQEHGFTPLFVRYNSGLPIADNGAELSQLLDALIELYPRRIRQLVLIGHSMGGLVARSALTRVEGTAWQRPLSHVFCLGSPHLGAPLEKAGWLAARALSATPITRPFARWIEHRSLGIKHLRHGYVQSTDSEGQDLDRAWGRPPQASPRPAHVRLGFIGCALGAHPEGPLSRSLGDGLVRLDSARARSLAGADWAALSRLHHLRLANHPAVYEQMVRWLEAPAMRP